MEDEKTSLNICNAANLTSYCISECHSCTMSCHFEHELHKNNYLGSWGSINRLGKEHENEC